MAKKILKIFLILVILTLAVIGVSKMFFRFNKGKTYYYKADDEVFDNPYTGFAPSCDSADLCEKSSLVYMNLMWSELESEEGVFDWEKITEENNLDMWYNKGKHLVLRFVCDYPRKEEHMDIPKWLYEKTGDGEFYDCEYGKGYCPDYNNEVFIEAHKKVIDEIGKHFSENDFLAYVELGSLGHWGEWHTYYQAGIPGMPLSEVRSEYVDHYVEAFPYARLLMRRPFTERPEGTGVYNDMTGDEEDTLAWLSWIEEGGEFTQTKEKDGLRSSPDIWNTAPVGGEFTSSTPMSTLLGDELDTTLSLLEASHMTFIGPKVPEANRGDDSISENLDEVLKRVGYRYRVSSLNMRKINNEETELTATICNDGVAPIYFKYDPFIYIYHGDSTDIYKYQLDINLMEIYQNYEETCTITVPSKLLKEEGTQIYIGIDDPDTSKAAIYLNMDADRNDHLSLLWEK